MKGHFVMPFGPNGPQFQIGGGNTPEPPRQASVHADAEIAMRIPPRVHLALRFIDLMAHHAMKRAAIAEGYEVDLMELPGLDLSLDHLAAVKSASNALISFFNGEFKEGEWEKKQEDRRKTGTGSAVNCPFCREGRSPEGETCELCKGAGTILVYPIFSPGD